MSMQNNQACVWATRRELWDSFLSDPAFAQAIDTVRTGELESHTQKDNNAKAPPASEEKDEDVSGDDEQSIGVRLRAYETPITDDILRQSIR